MKPTYEELEQQLAESHRALRAETTAHENTQMQLEKMAAENAGLKAAIETHKHGFVRCNCCGDELMCHTDDVCRALDNTPATDAFLAEIKTAIEYPKNNSSSNGWTIDPEFLSRVEERAGAVYGYYPGLEETEAALLAGMDLLRERAVQ
ncbi:TPA: hypothetical protein SCR70_002495 [Enterobacter kobei]|nr:hypothetical protein [Enterobacter kobei]